MFVSHFREVQAGVSYPWRGGGGEVGALFPGAIHVLTEGAFQGHPPWMSGSSQRTWVRGRRDGIHISGATVQKFFTFNQWDSVTWPDFNKGGTWSPVGHALPDNFTRINMFCGQLSVSSTGCSLKCPDTYTKEIIMHRFKRCRFDPRVKKIPRSGRSPGGGCGNPLQYSCLKNPMDRGAWWAIVYGAAESQTWLSD